MRRIGLAVLITVVSLIAPFDPLAGESTKGWYLLEPPVDETSNVLFGILNQAPLTQWKRIATYDTEAACDQGSRAEGDARGRRLDPRSTARRIVEAAPGAAPRFGLELRNVLVSGQGDLDRIFTEIGRGRADAILVQPSPDIDEMRGRIAQLAEKQRLPSMFAWRQYAEVGGLMSYGADLYDLQQHVASYVDKILKGAKPADLPIEQPTKFELVINLKTAKALGLTIPQSVLGRADQVIE